MMTKAPTWFMIAAALGLLWMAFGCFAYVSEMRMDAATLATLPDLNQQLITGRPTWATALFAIAVWGGLIGTLMLLMRKALAVPILLVAMLATLGTYAWPLALSGLVSQFGGADWGLTIAILGIQIALWALARNAKAKGWLS